jgi:hypothetical protein
MSWAHELVGQVKAKDVTKYRLMYKHWQPQHTFVKKLIISWDLTAHGLLSDDRLHLNGACQQLRSLECIGRKMYRTVSDDGLLGEFMLESRCRFKPSVMERHITCADQEHEKVCFKCRRIWDYRRFVRGLPADSDERWV